MNKKEKSKLSKLAILADKAFKAAVAKVMEEHRRSGQPIAIWRGDKVVVGQVDELLGPKPAFKSGKQIG